MKLPEGAFIEIKSAEQVQEHALRLTFSDGAEQIVDFGPFLRASQNPLISAYLNPAQFARFSIKDGDLIWGDYDLCFPIADLYEGRI